MKFALDTALFFLFFAIPGILFKRFYYWGAFSNQFNLKNWLPSVLFASIIGFPIQLATLHIYRIFFHEVNTQEIKTIKEELKTLSENLISRIYETEFLIEIGWYLLIMVVLTVVLAQSLFRFVRFFGLDRHIHMLRFEDRWHYYLKGEFTSFKGFRKKKAFFVVADVLVSTSDGNQLISGTVASHSTNKNTNELDHIYLVKPFRWKKRKIEQTTNSENYSSTETIEIPEKKPIKSDCFIIHNRNIINLNLTVYTLSHANSHHNNNYKDPSLFSWKNLSPILTILLFIYPFIDIGGYIGDFYQWEDIPQMSSYSGKFILGASLTSIPMILTNMKRKEGEDFNVVFWGSLLVIGFIYGILYLLRIIPLFIYQWLFI